MQNPDLDWLKGMQPKQKNMVQKQLDALHSLVKIPHLIFHANREGKKLVFIHSEEYLTLVNEVQLLQESGL